MFLVHLNVHKTSLITSFIGCEYGRGEYGINLSKGRVIRPLSLGKFSGTAQVTPFQVTTEDIDVLPPISSTTSDTAGSGSDVLASSIDPNNSEAPNNGPCASFSMHLVPDKFGNETTWKLYKWDDVDDDIDITPKADISGPKAKGGGNSRFLLREIAISRREKESIVDSLVFLEGGPYSYQEDFDNEAIGSHYNAIIAETCLPVGSYKFILYDAEEDGICCEVSVVSKLLFHLCFSMLILTLIRSIYILAHILVWKRRIWNQFVKGACY